MLNGVLSVTEASLNLLFFLLLLPLFCLLFVRASECVCVCGVCLPDAGVLLWCLLPLLLLLPTACFFSCQCQILFVEYIIFSVLLLLLLLAFRKWGLMHHIQRISHVCAKKSTHTQNLLCVTYLLHFSAQHHTSTWCSHTRANVLELFSYLFGYSRIGIWAMR